MSETPSKRAQSPRKRGEARPDRATVARSYRDVRSAVATTGRVAGSVTLDRASGAAPAKKRSLGLSQKAMREVTNVLLKPGVVIHLRKGVAKYYADAHEPGVLVRVLNGKRTRGSFVNGKFRSR